MEIAAGLPFEAVFESGLTGLVPGLQLSITDNVGNTFLAASSAGITEQTIDANPNTGIYAVTLTAPAVAGQYTLTWSTDGSFAEFTVTVEGLDVIAVGNILPAPGMPTTQGGPCSMWANVNDITDCCSLPDTFDPAVDAATLLSAMVAASEVLYFASGKRYAGSCERTVRPCKQDSCGCGYQVLSRGHLVGWNGDCWAGYACGCQALSRVKLAGYATEIVEVKIDGIVVGPGEYRLDENKWLTRMNGSRWPRCQALDLDDTEVGTFSVEYIYGKTPPELGRLAALSLACEVFKSCTPGAECALPTGVTRVTRQGITIERTFLQRDQHGVWRTGIANVDMFLNAVNPAGLSRRGTVWSPSSSARYARPVGG